MVVEKFSRTRNQGFITNINVPYKLNNALDILVKHENKKLYSTRKLPIKIIDDFLLSGRFNSVLGLEGFAIFKKCLKKILLSINDNDFSSNIINLDIMFEALLDSGLYYNDEHAPLELKYLESDSRWLTAYRYISKNFPEIGYQDFRTIVKRFKRSKGVSFYVKDNDSDFLQAIPEKDNLFKEVIELEPSLMLLKMTELRKICKKVNLLPARSIKETVKKLVDLNDSDIINLLPSKKKDRIILIIEDYELANGQDLINLDKYLRELAKIIRTDFSNFILSRRHISFYKEI